MKFLIPLSFTYCITLLATGVRVADIAFWKAELNTEINLMEQEMGNLEVSRDTYVLSMSCHLYMGCFTILLGVDIISHKIGLQNIDSLFGFLRI
jgi:hypothetical protein